MSRRGTWFSEHIARYAFAINYCFKRNVLDLGSKDGFGSFVMSYVANHIDLADISGKWLGWAKELRYACPTDYHVVDLEKDFPEGEWDTMVAFEVIEHLANPEVLIENVKKHLKPGGFFVFSVPHMIANHEHKTLFDEEKIKDLISKHLTLVEFYVQDRKIFSGKPTKSNVKCYLGVAVNDRVVR